MNCGRAIGRQIARHFMWMWVSIPKYNVGGFTEVSINN